MQVVKLGGRTQSDPRLGSLVEKAFGNRSGAMCIVHGGGDEVSVLQTRLGLSPKMHGGRRVTSAEDLEVVQMVLSGSANKRLVSLLVGAGLSAVGISGEDARLIEADSLDPVVFGMVGTPVRIEVRLLRTLLSNGYLPVISPVSRHTAAEGGALNVNGDDAAAAIAAAIEATELLFVSDVAGVRGGNGETLEQIDVEQAGLLIESGVAEAGMKAKLEAAARALQDGVSQVRIGDIESIGDPHRGTLIKQLGRVTG